jgi:hypothetical protein
MIIISKIELEGTDDLKYTDVGYTTDILVANEINEAYDSSLGKFLGENRTKLQLGEVSVSTFFNGVSYVNEARTEVETVDGLGISEVTNVNQL